MRREIMGLRHPQPHHIYCSSLRQVLLFRRHSHGPVSPLFKQWEISHNLLRLLSSLALCRTPSSSSLESCSLPHLHGIASLTFHQRFSLGSLQSPHSASFISNASSLSSSPVCPAFLYFLTVIKKPKFCFSLAFCDSSVVQAHGSLYTFLDGSLRTLKLVI